MKYFRYLWYVIRHKRYVASNCHKYGLHWLARIHDWSKLRPSEFFPYAKHFYGKNKKEWRDETGYYKPTDTGDPDFDYAWLLHQKRNKHHWQWWVLPEDSDGIKILPIPVKYRLEMLCDWLGASAAQGHGGDLASVAEWYKKNGNKMQLHPETRQWIINVLTPAISLTVISDGTLNISQHIKEPDDC
jgi:hypothetical protein